MKYILIVLIIFNFSAHAAELEITTAVIHYKEANDVQAYIYNPRGYVTKTQHTYNAILILKNISKSNISIATGILKASQEKGLDQPTEITIEHNKPVTSNSELIPSVSDLKIVVIRPNESARIKHDFTSFKMIDKAYITYSMDKYYDNRFGYWTGSVKSNLINIKNPKQDN